MPRTSRRSQLARPPSIASTLPIEIIALIFTFYYASVEWQDTDLFRDPKKDETPSLVCRSWRRPAQRHLLKIVHVHNVESVAELTDLLSSNMGSGMGQLVRTLHLCLCDEEEKAIVKQGDVNRLLVLLPNLIDLRLLIPEKGDYSRLIKLPNLQRLLLDSYAFDSELVTFRQILSKTTNITYLALSNRNTTEISLPLSNLKRINLPHLNHLSLQSNQFLKVLHKLKFLTDATLGRVEHLQIDVRVGEDDEHSPLGFVDTIGKGIKTLTLGKTKCSSKTELLAACPNVETFVATEAGNITSFPPKLTKFICKRDMWDNLSWIIEESLNVYLGYLGITQKEEDWRHVKSVEVHVRSARRNLDEWWESEWKEIEEHFEGTHVKLSLFIDAILQEPNLISADQLVLHKGFFSISDWYHNYYI